MSDKNDDVQAQNAPVDDNGNSNAIKDPAE